MPYDVEWARLEGGLELPYVEHGDPAGTPLVCLHGYAESWRSFELLLADLPSSIHAFAVSQRGHGGPRTMAGSCSLEELAGDVVAFMDSVGVDAAVLAGSSSGGYVAQQLAVAHPERVAGLVLIGSPRTLQGVPEVERFARRLRGLPEAVEPGFVRDFVSDTVVRPVPETFLETMVKEGAAVPAHVWRETLEALTEATPPTEAGSISAPALILWGDRDRFVPRAEVESLRVAISGSTLVVYEGTGHVPVWEEPLRVAADVAGFVARLGYVS